MDVQQIMLGTSACVSDAMRAMTDAHSSVVVVCHDDGRLIGTVTDGDVRRAIVSGGDLQTPLREIANPKPVVVQAGASMEEMVSLMRSTRKQALPVVDTEGRVVGIEHLSELIALPSLPNTAVVMAGGFGTRMRPFTDTLPKPMLSVGGRPLIELIIEGLVEQGIRQVVLLLHHMPDRIIDALSRRSFGDTAIEFIIEEEPLGTAGGLVVARQLLASDDFFVLNGDSLTRPNWREMLVRHTDQNNAATVGCTEYSVQVPYGVLSTDSEQVVSIQEKPIRTWLTVCGAYCLSPAILDFLPKQGRFDMPDLVSAALDAGQKVGHFPMDDVTRLEDLTATHRGIWLAEGNP